MKPREQYVGYAIAPAPINPHFVAGQRVMGAPTGLWLVVHHYWWPEWCQRDAERWICLHSGYRANTEHFKTPEAARAFATRYYAHYRGTPDTWYIGEIPEPMYCLPYSAPLRKMKVGRPWMAS